MIMKHIHTYSCLKENKDKKMVIACGHVFGPEAIELVAALNDNKPIEETEFYKNKITRQKEKD